jgi:SOS-response transcriptional repressor LexA
MGNTMGDSLGERVKELREEAGLLAAELGRMTGLDPGYIGRIERGEFKPGADILVKLASTLNTSIDYIVTGRPIRQAAPKEPQTVGELFTTIAKSFKKLGVPEIHYLGEMEPVPIRGHIPAGNLAIREEETGSIVLVSKAKLDKYPNHARIYAVVVDGDSLKGDDINKGDRLIVREQSEFDIENKIYIIRDPNTKELVARHLVRSGNLVIAQSSNPAYKPLILDSIEVLGRVIMSVPEEKDL